MSFKSAGKKTERRIVQLLNRIQRGNQQAVAELQKMAKRYPGNPQVINAMGCLALERGDGQQALACFERSRRCGYNHRKEQQRNLLIANAMIGEQSAFDLLWEAINLDFQENHPKVNLLRSCLQAARVKNQADMAKHCLTLWQEIDPDDPKLALAAIGVSLHQQDRDTALETLKTIPPIPPDDVADLLSAAQYAHKLKHPAAVHYFSKAYEAQPTDANLLQRLITLGLNLKQFKEVISLFDVLLENYPDLAESKLYDRLNLYQQANCWDEVERLVPEYLDAVRKGGIRPGGLFRHLSLPGLTDADHLILANAFLAGKPEISEPAPKNVLNRPPRQGRKLRVGYLSADFKQHPVAQLIVEVLERHDRIMYEIVGYDLAEDSSDLLRERVLSAFDTVVPAHGLSNEDLIDRIRRDDIDILIDLQGDTAYTRAWLLRHRLAPVQVGWLGFPGGLGQGVNDYILADRHVIPESAFPYFAEKPVWLPHTYIPNDPERQPLEMPPRLAQNLPEDAVVFCCFNGQYKITREIFHAWCRILQQTENSVLWLRKEDPYVREHFRQVAQDHNVDSDRLVFAPRTQTQIDHLSRLQCADIALDTRPYNAHTTTIDALWSCLPVITLPGNSFTSRVATSILHVAGLEQWVATDIEDYINKAVCLAQDRARLAVFKEKLGQLRTSCVLYNTSTFVHGLEAAFEAMYARFEQGLSPEPITHLTYTEEDESMLRTQNVELSLALLLEEAETFLYKERVQPAVERYLKVLERMPEHPSACHGLGLAYGLSGQYDTALSWLDKALEQKPDDKTWQRHREIMLEKHERNHATNLSQQLTQAQQAHERGDLVTASILYDAVLEHSPKHPAALHYKGLAEVQQGIHAGLEKMHRALQIQPHNKTFLQNYRRALARFEREDDIIF